MITSEAALGTPHEDMEESSKISAYARLDFANYTFFVQTLQVVLGRKSNDELVLSSHHSVDVHLSSKKAISRRHAKIFYNFGTQRFEISILGRNGAFVDDTFVEKGMTVPVIDGTKIQIGDIPFTFVLPSIELHESDEKKPGTAKPFNPSDALNLRTNLYLTSTSPIRDHQKKSAVMAAKAQDRKERRSSRAEIVRRLSSARRKSLASSSNDEINALLKELETIRGDDDDEDSDLLDAETREFLREHSRIANFTDDQIQKEEDEIDELVKQHNLQQGVVLDEEKPLSVSKELQDIDMDISILDLEIASLAPLIDAHNQDLVKEKEEQRKQLELEKKRMQGNYSFRAPNLAYDPPTDPNLPRSAPLMGKPAGPRMGKPATIQPPANRAYGRQPVGVPTTYNYSMGTTSYSPYSGYPAGSSLYNPMMMTTRPPPPKLEVVVQTITTIPVVRLIIPPKAITTDIYSLETAPVCVFKSVEKLQTEPKIPRRKDALRKPSKVQNLKEIPEQFKSKPTVSLLSMVASVLRGVSGAKLGCNLMDIHEGIKELFPYYKYCPDGWQYTVTHNVKFNKMFKVVSKLGLESEWLWAVDDTYIAEKEKTRKKQQEVAMAKAKEAALKAVELRQKQRMDVPQYTTLGRTYSPYTSPYQGGKYPGLPPANGLQKPKSIAELASEIRRDGATPKTPMYFQKLGAGVPSPYSPSGQPGSTIKDQLAANRSRSSSLTPVQVPQSQLPPPSAPEKLAMNADTKKSLAYLQKELFTLYKARKLSYNTAVTTEIITKALATTIAQVNIIGAKAGCGDNALSFLVEKAPQQVSKILDIALTKSIKEKQGGSKPASRDGTPQPGPNSVPPAVVGTPAHPSPAESLPLPKPSGLSKPPSFAGSALSRPHFSGMAKPSFSKPGALLKPPQFLSNKPRPVAGEKRPAEENDEPKKSAKLEE